MYVLYIRFIGLWVGFCVLAANRPMNLGGQGNVNGKIIEKWDKCGQCFLTFNHFSNLFCFLSDIVPVQNDISNKYSSWQWINAVHFNCICNSKTWLIANCPFLYCILSLLCSSCETGTQVMVGCNSATFSSELLGKLRKYSESRKSERPRFLRFSLVEEFPESEHSTSWFSAEFPICLENQRE